MWPYVDSSICIFLALIIQWDFDYNVRSLTFVLQTMYHGLIDIENNSFLDSWTHRGQVDRLLLSERVFKRSHVVNHLQGINGLQQVHLVKLNHLFLIKWLFLVFSLLNDHATCIARGIF